MSYASPTPQRVENHDANSHFADKTIFIDWSSLLPCTRSWCLCPHLLHILQHHIAMSVECLHAGQQLSVVSARDEDLCVGSNSGLEDREGTRCKLVFFKFSNLELAVTRSA